MSKLKKSYIPTISVICIVIALLAYFSCSFVFYEFIQDVSSYSIKLEKCNKNVAELNFSYGNNEVTLQYSSSLKREDVRLYALNINGVTSMGKENMQNLNPDYLGSFIATVPVQYMDVDNDGNYENLYISAKTDMEFAQRYMPTPPTFDNESFPLEVIFSDRTTISIYFNREALANKKITVTSKGRDEKTYTTDAEGIIKGLKVLDIRRGISVGYKVGERDFYIMNYRVEDNAIFSMRHLYAMIPFILIVLVSLVGIVVCMMLRKGIMKKDPVYGKIYKQRTFPMKEGKSHCQKKFGFMTIRWVSMIISFVLLVYGTRIFGKWFTSILIPVFSCPINQDQLIGSNCYYLAHLDGLFSLPWKDIMIFIVSLLLSLVLLGRTICGFICPMGLLQDIVHEIRQVLKIEGVSLNEKLYTALKPVKWVLVLLFLGLCFTNENFCNFCPAIAVSPAFAGFKVSLYTSGFIMVIVIIGSFFKKRFWCTICPLGYIIGLFYKISLFRLKKDCQACTECGACYEACPVGIKSIYTERKKEDVTTTDCIMCGECINKCPENNALSMTFAGKKFYIASRKTFMSGYKGLEKKIFKNTR